MKKIFALVAAASLSVASLFAFDFAIGARGNFNIGAGTSYVEDDDSYISLTIASIKSAYSFIGLDETTKGNVGGGFSVYANLGLFDFGAVVLGLQPEVGMNFNNGLSIAYDADGTIPVVGTKYSYNNTFTLSSATLDIPLLITVDIKPTEKLKVGFGLGPLLSVPVAVNAVTDLSYEFMGQSGSETVDFGKKSGYKIKPYRVNFGLAFDANAGLKAGPGYFIFDVRYLLDLTPTKAKVYIDADGDGTDDYTSGGAKYFIRRSLNLGLGYEFRF